ncbi:MAG: hypothetical protein LBJ25_04420 [Candidatus Margulisbacteria bacterium]|jgi:hypothetical protein|nr:hypothetical protein [Candidatus Margulisiibacteriota bacterium]
MSLGKINGTGLNTDIFRNFYQGQAAWPKPEPKEVTLVEFNTDLLNPPPLSLGVFNRPFSESELLSAETIFPSTTEGNQIDANGINPSKALAELVDTKKQAQLPVQQTQIMEESPDKIDVVPETVRPAVNLGLNSVPEYGFNFYSTKSGFSSYSPTTTTDEGMDAIGTVGSLTIPFNPHSDGSQVNGSFTILGKQGLRLDGGYANKYFSANGNFSYFYPESARIIGLSGNAEGRANVNDILGDLFGLSFVDRIPVQIDLLGKGGFGYTKTKKRAAIHRSTPRRTETPSETDSLPGLAAKLNIPLSALETASGVGTAQQIETNNYSLAPDSQNAPTPIIDKNYSDLLNEVKTYLKTNDNDSAESWLKNKLAGKSVIVITDKGATIGTGSLDDLNINSEDVADLLASGELEQNGDQYTKYALSNFKYTFNVPPNYTWTEYEYVAGNYEDTGEEDVFTGNLFFGPDVSWTPEFTFEDGPLERLVLNTSLGFLLGGASYRRSLSGLDKYKEIMEAGGTLYTNLEDGSRIKETASSGIHIGDQKFSALLGDLHGLISATAIFSFKGEATVGVESGKQFLFSGDEGFTAAPWVKYYAGYTQQLSGSLFKSVGADFSVKQRFFDGGETSNLYNIGLRGQISDITIGAAVGGQKLGDKVSVGVAVPNPIDAGGVAKVELVSQKANGGERETAVTLSYAHTFGVSAKNQPTQGKQQAHGSGDANEKLSDILGGLTTQVALKPGNDRKRRKDGTWENNQYIDIDRKGLFKENTPIIQALAKAGLDINNGDYKIVHSITGDRIRIKVSAINKLEIAPAVSA